MRLSATYILPLRIFILFAGLFIASIGGGLVPLLPPAPVLEAQSTKQDFQLRREFLIGSDVDISWFSDLSSYDKKWYQLCYRRTPSSDSFTCTPAATFNAAKFTTVKLAHSSPVFVPNLYDYEMELRLLDSVSGPLLAYDTIVVGPVQNLIINYQESIVGGDANIRQLQWNAALLDHDQYIYEIFLYASRSIFGCGRTGGLLTEPIPIVAGESSKVLRLSDYTLPAEARGFCMGIYQIDRSNDKMTGQSFPDRFMPTPSPPGVPSNLNANPITQTTITLNWTEVSGASDYQVNGGALTAWANTGVVLKYEFTGLTANQSYTLQVRSLTGTMTSGAAMSTVKTLPNAPTAAMTSDITVNSIKLSWTGSVGGADSYEVSSNGTTWTDSGSDTEHEFTGLTASTAYTLSVRAKNASGVSAAVSAASATTLPNAPGAPSGLSATGITQTAITLNWTKVGGATSYEVNGGALSGWTDEGDVALYQFTGLTANSSYTLQVRALNDGGHSGASSSDAKTLPNAPTAAMTSDITVNSIKLSWTGSVGGADSYEVSSNGTTWTDSGSDTEHEFTGLTASTAYTLSVRAKNASGVSAAVSAASATTLPNAPGAPSGLSATGITQTAITLNWTKVGGATSYEVNGGALSGWTDEGDVALYQFTGLTANSQYTLQVRAISGGGPSAASSSDAKTLPNAPTAPTTSDITVNSIKLSWTGSVGGADSYEASSDGTTWTDSGSDTEHEFTGLTASTAYTLSVRAKNASGVSAAVSAASATTLPNAPGAPSGLSATGITQTAITLNWTKVGGATSYEVNGGALSGWTDEGDVALYQFTGLTANSQYTLQVRALNDGGHSGASSSDAKTLPNAPTAAMTSEITANSIKLSWTGSVGGADSYEVSSNGTTWAAADSATEHEFTGLTASTAYTLSVRAKNVSGVSGAVSAASATTLPAAPGAPSGLSATGITQTAITLNWTKVGGATSYEVNGGALSGWTDEGDVALYQFTGLTANSSYTLQVRALNDGGHSGPASAVTKTLPNAPTAAMTSDITVNSIKLSWTGSVGGADSYEVSSDGTTWAAADSATEHEFTGLSAGTSYTLSVRAKNASGVSAAVSAASATTLPNAPGAPSGLSVTGITQTAITLNWTKVAGSSGYEMNGGALSAWTAAGDVALYQFTDLTANSSYTLQVRALNDGGHSGPASAVTKTLPNAPTAAMTSDITVNSIKLSWTGSVGGADSYEVSSDGTTWTDSGSDTEHEFTGLTASTAYTLSVRAKNASGVSAAVSAASATTLPNAPGAPSGLSATGITQTAITLNWTKVGGATSYEVNGGALSGWTDEGDVALYQFTGLTANSSYTLQVRALNDGGHSAASSSDAKTLPNAPTAPTTSDITVNSIKLSWTGSVGGADSYEVSSDGTTWTDSGSDTEHEFTGLSASTAYTLSVRAKNTSGVSAAVSAASATTLPNAPGAPSGLSVTGITQTAITLNWTKVGGATSYEMNGGALSAWTAAGDVALYQFTGLTANSQYTLQVRAISGGGPSAASSSDAKTLPNAPTAAMTSDITVNSIKLSWTGSVGGADSYEVSSNGTTWTDSGSDTEHEFTGLTASTAYTLSVRAKNASGVSAAVSAASATTLPNAPGAPSGLSATGITQTAITLNWTKVGGATSYEVNGGALSGWTDEGDVALYQFTGLTANSSYTLQVRAISGGGPSAASSSDAKTLPNAPTAPTTSDITVNSIKLSWTGSVGGADSYEVSSDGTTWTDSGSDTEHEFTGLTASTAYTLSVRAKNASGVSAAVSAASATTLPNAPGAPTGLKTTGITQTAITLNWTKVAGATSYEMNGGALSAWTAAGDVALYQFTGLTANSQYTLQVRAISGGGPSAASSSVAKTLPNAPPDTPIPPQALSLGKKKKSPTNTPRPTRTPTPIFSTCLLLPDEIIVSNFYAQTQCQQVNQYGIGIAQVIERGVVDAVDVWGWVPPRLQVCFRNQGWLVFLDAAKAPRVAEPLSAFPWGDMTCANIDRAGTVVLLRAPLFPDLAATPSNRMRNCMVTLQATLNFRDAPAGNIISVLPALVRLTALERTADWFKVDYYGQQGWVSADYVQTDGDC